MTDAEALDILAAFREGGPGGEVPVGEAVDRLLIRHLPGYALHALYLLVDQGYVDWRSTEGHLYLAADGHWYGVAQAHRDEMLRRQEAKQG